MKIEFEMPKLNSMTKVSLELVPAGRSDDPAMDPPADTVVDGLTENEIKAWAHVPSPGDDALTRRTELNVPG